jgi:predicted phosphodiesterase
MRILIASDLHLELGNAFVVPEDVVYDLVVLAGDIHSPGHRAVTWAQRPSTFGGRPVIFVPGNHEFYNRELGSELALMRNAAAGSNVHLLAPGCVVLEGVRFLGCTLWTDFQLAVGGDEVGALESKARAMAAAKRSMNDYALIRIQDSGGFRRHPRPLEPADTLAIHHAERTWLLEKLQAPFDGLTVVVTHTGPSDGSVAPKYAADWCTPAFVSHLPDEFFDVPVLWIHGHTHTRFDYQRGGCRVVSEPRGYRMRDGSWENPAFDGKFVIEVPVGTLDDLARETFQSPSEAADWLRRPHPVLDGMSPLECANSGPGAQRVRDMLVAIRQGGVV